jgi:CheY-like chemotaxis protein
MSTPPPRVAVVGAGVTGCALALSLVNMARSRGKALDVTLFGGPSEASHGPPAVLTPDCRNRLAVLGASPAPASSHELRGIEVIAGERRHVLSVGGAGLVVLGGGALSGQQLVAESLRVAAVERGVSLRPGRVSTLASEFEGAMVRGSGPGHHFSLVLLTTGAGDTLAERFLPALQGARTLPALHAWLQLPSRASAAGLGRLWFRPVPGIEALLLIPQGHRVFVRAHGPDLTPSSFCQALMAASRDGHLPAGFELSGLTPSRVPNGAGRRVAIPGFLAVGPLAMGHPLELGVTDTLRVCARTALAVVDTLDNPKELRAVYARTMDDVAHAQVLGARAARRLSRSGAHALRALHPSGRRAAGYPPPACLLGLPNLPPADVLIRARLAGLAAWAERWLLAPFRATRLPLPVLEKNLFYVVDDDAEVREGLTELLEAQGAHVVAFRDELALYAAVAHKPPSGIFLDVVLPWVDGLSLLEGLGRHPSSRGVPVYIMTGLDRPHLRARAQAAGARAFLRKPFTASALWQLLGTSPRSSAPYADAAVPSWALSAASISRPR